MKAKDVLKMFPELCFDAYAKTDKLKEKKIKKGVIVYGMGGSAIAGIILKDIVKEFPIIINNNSNLPEYSNKYLNVFISYSGNTEETLIPFRKAKRKKMKTFVISSGGKLKKYTDFILPPKFQPRFSLPYMLMPLLKITGQINEKKAWDLFSFLKKEQREIEKKAKQVAEEIEIPVLYVPNNYKGVGYRFQTQINENAKSFAHFHYLTEMCHNEINAKLPPNFQVLLAEEQEDKTISFLKKEKKRKKTKVIEIKIKGNSVLEKTFYLLYLLDYVSFFFAKKKKTEIDKVEVIERLKKYLAKK